MPPDMPPNRIFGWLHWVVLGDQAAEADLALAAATMLFWLSEVFSRTTLYTRFFSFEEALEMNSEKEVFLVVGFVVKNFMLSI